MAITDPVQSYEPWDGILAGFDHSAKRIFFVLQDARETETPWINSASSWTDIAFNYVDLYDTKFHNLMFGWASSGSLTAPIFGTSQDTIRKGMIGVDNFIFYPIDDGYSSISGKSTPFTVAFDNAGNPTNWAFGGYYPDRASATSKTTGTLSAVRCFNGEIASITIWDTLLDATASLNNNLFVQSNVGGGWGAASRGDNPLTGTNLAKYKGNCVAHFEMRDGVLANRLVTDQAGNTVSGNQTAPTTGHTLYLLGANANLFGQWDYLIYDMMQPDPTISFPNGLLQFIDEAGIARNVGTIFYDLGIVILDNEYINSTTNTLSGLPFMQTMTVSGMGYGNVTGFSVHYVNYDNVNKFQRLIINTKAESDEFNITQNPTGVVQQTGTQYLINHNPGAYVTTVGLYSSINELLAVAKLDSPVRKDKDHTVSVNVNLDF